MRILTRYIIKEHLGPFWFSLLVIMFVFVTKFIAQYIGKIFGKGLPFSTILEFIYLNLAWMLALAIPMSVLVAALMAFGRLSADNEITILKTSGISLYQVIRPVLIAAAFLTVLMIAYNDRLLPEFNHRARLLYYSISQKKPALQLEKGIYLNLNHFSILVGDIEKPLKSEMMEKGTLLGPQFSEGNIDKLKNITIFDLSSTEVQRTVISRFGYLTFDREREQLVFNLYDGEIHEIDNKDFAEYRRLKFTRNVFYIPAPELVFRRTEDTWRGDREMTIGMMKEKIRQARAQILKEKMQVRKALTDYLDFSSGFAAKPPATTLAEPIEFSGVMLNVAQSRALRSTQAVIQKIQNARANISFQQRQIYKYEVEIHKKFSIPFACIVFVLIGAPLGIRARKGSLGIGITFSIGFFLLYWVFLIAGEELADRQLISPFLSMWAANIIVGAFGIYLTVRSVRETTFVQWEKLPRILQLFFKGAEEGAR